MGTNYKALFAAVASAKPMNTYAANLPEGRNRVTLLHFGLKDSQKNEGTIVEAEFDCNGETRGCAWWPERSGWSGAFNKDRLQKFVTAIKQSIGDDRDIDEVMASLAATEQHGRGILLEVEVTRKLEDNGQPMIDKKGNAVYETTFRPITQTMDQVRENRAKFDGPGTKGASSGAGAGAGSVLGFGG